MWDNTTPGQCEHKTSGGGCADQSAHPNDILQEVEGLVNGGIGIKANSRFEFVMHDGLQALCQAVSFLTQLLLLLRHCGRVFFQLLIVPAQHSRHDLAWQSTAQHVMTQHGIAYHGLAEHGKAQCSMAP